ncbi:MAG: hypothetical protein ACJ73N_10400 [Bryobacteraceae bacterium]
MQVKLDRRFSDLNITTAYTFGKGLAFQDADDAGLLFYANQRRNYARNNFDRKHTFVQSYIYDLPFGPGKRFLTSGLMDNIFGGWRVTGVLTFDERLTANSDIWRRYRGGRRHAAKYAGQHSDS